MREELAKTLTYKQYLATQHSLTFAMLWANQFISGQAPERADVASFSAKMAQDSQNDFILALKDPSCGWWMLMEKSVLIMAVIMSAVGTLCAMMQRTAKEP